MKFNEKLTEHYQKSFLEKNGDRLVQVQGNVISTKIVTEKTILWLYHKFLISIVVKPERSKTIIRCEYKKNAWFSKPQFMHLTVGHFVAITGLKSLKKTEVVEIMQIRNYTTKKDLIEMNDAPPMKRTQQFKRK